MKILIVDDSNTSRMLLRTILQAAGYPKPHEAESALEAVDLLELDPEAQGPPPFDLILMDVVMPGMNGIEATRAIKADPRFKQTPIILITGHEDESDLDGALEAGAADFIRKPVKKQLVQEKVAAALGR